MSGNQSSLPLVGSPFKFSQHGESGAWISELLPHTAKIADDMLRDSLDVHRGDQSWPRGDLSADRQQFPGRPSMGAWLDYGLGSENEDLPAFVVW